MRKIEDILSSGLETSEDELRQEISERENLLSQMVGWLYPPIIRNEIQQIQELLNETGTHTS